MKEVTDMKNVKFCGMFLIIVLLFCGCQETPEQVKENMKQYGDNSQVEVSEITYCSPEELKNVSMTEDTGNGLRLPEAVNFSGVETVELLHLSIEKDFLADQTVSKYTKLFGVDKDELEEVEAGESSWGKSFEYDSEKQRKYLSIMENGGMSYLAGTSYDFASNEIEKKYDMDREDVSEVEIELSDGTVNLARFCKKTEQWMDTNMQVDGFSYKISDVYVRKPDGGSGGQRKLSMCAEYDHKGIRLDDYTGGIQREEDDFSMKEIASWLAVQLDFEDSGIPSHFSRNLHVVMDSAEPVEKIVEPDSAARILKEKLSGFGVFHISKVLPLYALYTKDYEESPGAEIEARPVYAFLVENHKEDPQIGVIKTNNCEHFFLVDMITGEVTTDLDLKRE